MFTLEQIQQAHDQVKSGVDFPNYIQALKKLGVLYYEVFVADGQTNFYGDDNFKVSTPAKHPDLSISEKINIEQFKSNLLTHQQGKTNYHTFCVDCGASGIEKWVVSIEKMNCTYYDKEGNELLVEAIPE